MGDGQSPFMMCQSLWQTPEAFILTRTSPAFGGSSSQSTTCKGSLGLNRTAAFIASSDRGRLFRRIVGPPRAPRPHAGPYVGPHGALDAARRPVEQRHHGGL